LRWVAVLGYLRGLRAWRPTPREVREDERSEASRCDGLWCLETCADCGPGDPHHERTHTTRDPRHEKPTPREDPHHDPLQERDAPRVGYRYGWDSRKSVRSRSRSRSICSAVAPSSLKIYSVIANATSASPAKT